MSIQRAYWSIPINDNREPLVEIPLQDFAAASIHDYQKLGAPYLENSPYAVRPEILKGLYKAQAQLQCHDPNWRIYIFDAYRPLAVQGFMANHAFDSLIQDRNLQPSDLGETETQELWQDVYKIWAPPNQNPLTPPPHSTGAAVDLTIFDQTTKTCIEMGSPIDEMSPRSHPDYFANLVTAENPGKNAIAQVAAKHRQLLADAMSHAGFQRHPGEWWHFCLGDQMWVWLSQPNHPEIQAARYGRYDLLKTGDNAI